MAYTKTNWQDDVTPLSAQNLNKIEQGIEDAHKAIEEPLYQTVTSEGESVISLPESTIDKGQFHAVELYGQSVFQFVKNGNFADGTTNWSATGGTSATNNTLSVIGDGTSNNFYAYQTTIKKRNGLTVYARLKVRVTDSNCEKIELSLGGHSHTIVTNPVANTWYYFNVKYLDAVNDNVDYIIVIKATYVDATTANGKVMEVQEVMAIDLDQHPQFDGMTADEINQAVPNWLPFGVNSTVCAYRIKSINKNLYNGKWLSNPNVERVNINEENYIKIYGDSNILTKLIDIKFKPNTQYTFKLRAYEDVDEKNTRLSIVYTDGTFDNMFVPTTAEQEFVFTSDSGKTIDYVAGVYSSGGGYLYIKENSIQIQEGTSITEDIEHDSDECYILATDENGNIIKLNSLMNGTKDEFQDGVLTKNTWEDNNISDTKYDSLDTTTYTNVDVIKTTAFSQAKVGTTSVDGMTRYYDKNGIELTEVAQADIDNVNSVGKYYWHTDGTLWIIVAKGTYADIASARTGLGTTSLIYQLASPKYYYLNVTPLTAFANGTVYFEKVVPEVAFYDSVDGCVVTHSDYPISSIDFIRKVNQQDGSYIELDVSQAVIAGDGLSFTHPDLQDGDLIDWDYFYAEELSTYPSSSLTVACNHKAETQSHGEAIQQLSKNVENIDTRTKANTQNIEELQDPATIKTLYESNNDTNVFTDAEKTKLAGIETGATVGVGDKTYGNATYTDSIDASSTLTKTIPLGDSFSHGQLTINYHRGLLILFGTNNLKTLAVGVNEDGNVSAWNSEENSKILGEQSDIMYTPTGHLEIGIDECYINGTDLIITFRNYNATTAQNLNCTIYWEVWK